MQALNFIFIFILFFPPSNFYNVPKFSYLDI